MSDIKVIDIKKDKRINCYSIMISMNLDKYLQIVDKAYEDNGGIEGQRIPLSNRSAIRIRETMKKDILEGTVLPPIVIGCTIDDISHFDGFIENVNESTEYMSDILDSSKISIIDGMQRTTALKEIKKEHEKFEVELRVELWVTNSANNLIYRMLVLNTGQISWSLKKQLEVVFSHVKVELQNSIPGIALIESNDGGRSNRPKKYQVSHLVELYLSFSTRKCDVNLSEKVASEFAKQDVIDKSYNPKHLQYFIGIIKGLVVLDELISQDNGAGRRLFGDQNVRIGYCVAMATFIFGRAGRTIDIEKVEKNYNSLIEKIECFINKQKELREEELNNYWDFELMKELSSDYSKKDLPEFYKKSFEVLIEEEFKVENMGICWNH
ncbi:hypothetical protein [Clostridium baratii]|uniref:hypothetical protein n=1 Tax=Clostridium baratii TaxID=1561 RepID=UPI0030D1E988